MKKLKFILIIFIGTLLFIGCANNEGNVLGEINETPTTIVIDSSTPDPTDATINTPELVATQRALIGEDKLSKFEPWHPLVLLEELLNPNYFTFNDNWSQNAAVITYIDTSNRGSLTHQVVFPYVGESIEYYYDLSNNEGQIQVESIIPFDDGELVIYGSMTEDNWTYYAIYDADEYYFFIHLNYKDLGLDYSVEEFYVEFANNELENVLQVGINKINEGLYPEPTQMTETEHFIHEVVSPWLADREDVNRYFDDEFDLWADMGDQVFEDRVCRSFDERMPGDVIWLTTMVCVSQTPEGFTLVNYPAVNDFVAESGFENDVDSIYVIYGNDPIFHDRVVLVNDVLVVAGLRTRASAGQISENSYDIEVDEYLFYLTEIMLDNIEQNSQ